MHVIMNTVSCVVSYIRVPAKRRWLPGSLLGSL